MKKRILSVAARWAILLVGVASVCFFSMLRVRSVVLAYAESSARMLLSQTANEAVRAVTADPSVTYQTLAHVSRGADGSVLGIELDTPAINRFKSELMAALTEAAAKHGELTLKIPIGTLLRNEYTSGFGPSLTFRVQMSETAFLDFTDSFTSAGINQTLHRLHIRMQLNGCLLLMGGTDSVSVATTALVAQTVIVGKVPDAFTNVEEEPGDDTADILFNYAQ